MDMDQPWQRGRCPHIVRPATIYAPKGGSGTLPGPPFVSVAIDVRRCPTDRTGLYAGAMSSSSRLWMELVRPASLLGSADLTSPSSTAQRTGRDRTVDAVGCFIAFTLGALFLSPSLHGNVVPLSMTRIAVDIACGTLACVALWWRRPWALGVAVACLLLGMFSISATPAGLIALFSLAVHRPVRQPLLVVALWIPSILVFAAYSPTTDVASVVERVIPLVLAMTAWGMFLRARRQLLLSLRERAVRAEADQRLHEDGARRAERTRIAREMHDVLAHRISLLALHAGALEVRPDLPSGESPRDGRTDARHRPPGPRGAAQRHRTAPRSRPEARRHQLRSRPCPTSAGWSMRPGWPGRRSTSRCGSNTKMPCRMRWDATRIASSKKH